MVSVIRLTTVGLALTILFMQHDMDGEGKRWDFSVLSMASLG